ncbi:hypothetical protein BV379_09225 [Rhodovulum sulfidophilum]|nr:hypothetical protein BV379_09225 [Rhodovulum sulfidophilum]
MTERASCYGRPGCQPVFSDVAIKLCLSVKVLFKLPLRQTAGMLANRLARLIRPAAIEVQIGDKRWPEKYGGKPSALVDNTRDRQFDMATPDTVWGTGITYICTQQGFACLAVVIDLLSRHVFGWAMQS